jgi:antitoxin HicB
MPRARYIIVLRPVPEGGYTALVPALPGCVTHGRTLDEAREMARDAVSGYIRNLSKHNELVPTDEDALIASIEVDHIAVQEDGKDLIDSDPLLQLRGSGKDLWAGEDPDEYVRRLREGWD